MRRSPYGERGLKYSKSRHFSIKRGSLSLRRAWIEMHVSIVMEDGVHKSLSLRRAWIEIAETTTMEPAASCRSPYGERGLKFRRGRRKPSEKRRSPYGERGLK